VILLLLSFEYENKIAKRKKKIGERKGEKKKLINCCFLNGWITGSCSNTALIAFVTGHFDETLVAPASSPAKID
jgi:hypothetical protein